MKSRLHNPDTHDSFIYLPAWLCQIPSKELTLSSKIIYGRLFGISFDEKIVCRSSKQLSQETGIPKRTIDKSLSELRNKKLIKSYIPELGGRNVFEFYNHPWMHRATSPKYNKED